MKFALVVTASGLVKQWQDHAQFGYPDPATGEQLVPVADDYQFPSAPQWYANGAFTGSDPSQTPAVLLAQAQTAQITVMAAAYASAIAQDVILTTAAGVAKTFQADPGSVANAQAMIAAYKTAVPAGFYWVAKDNTQVPFTLADLQGLAKAMGDQGWAAFQNLQKRKASILAATTVAAAQAVTW